MRNLLLQLLSVVCVSCTHMTGDSTTGKYSLTSVATDLDGLAQSADRIVIMRQNQSKVPIAAIKTVGVVAGAVITSNLSEAVSNNATSVQLSEHGVSKAANANKTATDQLRIIEESKVNVIEAVPGVAKP